MATKLRETTRDFTNSLKLDIPFKTITLILVKIYTEGSRYYMAQLPRIDEGFQQLGHELTPYIGEADLVYSNNPWYDQIVADRAAGRLKAGAKVILNVLDIPEHIIAEFDTAKLRTQLLTADGITSISQWTKEAVGRHCSVYSEIIYQPIKPVTRNLGHFSIPEQPGLRVRFLSAARRSDPNKRANLWAAALQMLDIDHREVALAGSDPGWGQYWGPQTDANLTQLYGSVDFNLVCGRIEGLCMGALEAMAAGVIPVLCNDLTTRQELLPSSLFSEYDDVDPTAPAVARFIARYLNNEMAMVEMKERLFRHYQDHWASKTTGAAVAQSILRVYESIP